jgi:hypothetical protein
MDLRRIAKPLLLLPHLVRVVLGASACLLAAVMLLSLPLLRSHTFTTHFRSPEVRRSAARHTSVSPLHAEPKLELASCELEPVIRPQPQPHNSLLHREGVHIARASIIEVFHRLKLGPHRQADSEPPLQ